jgi:HEAT repeat protein
VPQLKSANTATRVTAIETLRDLGKAGASAAAPIAGLLNDEESIVRQHALSALDRWGNPDGDLELQAALLTAAEASPADQTPALRAHLRLWAAANANMQRSVTWLGKPILDPMPKEGLSRQETNETLILLRDLWDRAASRSALRTAVSERIAQLAHGITSKPPPEIAKVLSELAMKLKSQNGARSAYEAVVSVLQK